MTGPITSPGVCPEVPGCASPAYAGEAAGKRRHIHRVKANGADGLRINDDKEG